MNFKLGDFVRTEENLIGRVTQFDLHTELYYLEEYGKWFGEKELTRLFVHKWIFTKSCTIELGDTTEKVRVPKGCCLFIFFAKGYFHSKVYSSYSCRLYPTKICNQVVYISIDILNRIVTENLCIKFHEEEEDV
jgi:hypothetical protein